MCICGTHSLFRTCVRASELIATASVFAGKERGAGSSFLELTSRTCPAYSPYLADTSRSMSGQTGATGFDRERRLKVGWLVFESIVDVVVQFLSFSEQLRTVDIHVTRHARFVHDDAPEVRWRVLRSCLIVSRRRQRSFTRALRSGDS